MVREQEGQGSRRGRWGGGFAEYQQLSEGGARGVNWTVEDARGWVVIGDGGLLWWRRGGKRVRTAGRAAARSMGVRAFIRQRSTS